MSGKKIVKWEPDDFELEMTTHWSFPKRGDWATHDAKWRGNWSPYIPRNILLRYSNENDLILDFTAGSFSTAEACLNTKRRYVCIEKDIKYFNIAKERLENLY